MMVGAFHGVQSLFNGTHNESVLKLVIKHREIENLKVEYYVRDDGETLMDGTRRLHSSGNRILSEEPAESVSSGRGSGGGSGGGSRTVIPREITMHIVPKLSGTPASSGACGTVPLGRRVSYVYDVFDEVDEVDENIFHWSDAHDRATVVAAGDAFNETVCASTIPYTSITLDQQGAEMMPAIPPSAQILGANPFVPVADAADSTDFFWHLQYRPKLTAEVWNATLRWIGASIEPFERLYGSMDAFASRQMATELNMSSLFNESTFTQGPCNTTQSKLSGLPCPTAENETESLTLSPHEIYEQLQIRARLNDEMRQLAIAEEEVRNETAALNESDTDEDDNDVAAALAAAEASLAAAVAEVAKVEGTDEAAQGDEDIFVLLFNIAEYRARHERPLPTVPAGQDGFTMAGRANASSDDGDSGAEGTSQGGSRRSLAGKELGLSPEWIRALVNPADAYTEAAYTDDEAPAEVGTELARYQNLKIDLESNYSRGLISGSDTIQIADREGLLSDASPYVVTHDAHNRRQLVSGGCTDSVTHTVYWPHIAAPLCTTTLSKPLMCKGAIGCSLAKAQLGIVKLALKGSMSYNCPPPAKASQDSCAINGCITGEASIGLPSVDWDPITLAITGCIGARGITCKEYSKYDLGPVVDISNYVRSLPAAKRKSLAGFFTAFACNPTNAWVRSTQKKRLKYPDCPPNWTKRSDGKCYHNGGANRGTGTLSVVAKTFEVRFQSSGKWITSSKTDNVPCLEHPGTAGLFICAMKHGSPWTGYNIKMVAFTIKNGTIETDCPDNWAKRSDGKCYYTSPNRGSCGNPSTFGGYSWSQKMGWASSCGTAWNKARGRTVKRVDGRYTSGNKRSDAGAIGATWDGASNKGVSADVYKVTPSDFSYGIRQCATIANFGGKSLDYKMGWASSCGVAWEGYPDLAYFQKECESQRYSSLLAPATACALICVCFGRL